MLTRRTTSAAALLLLAVGTVILLVAMHRASGVAHGYDHLPLPIQNALLGRPVSHFLDSMASR